MNEQSTSAVVEVDCRTAVSSVDQSEKRRSPREDEVVDVTIIGAGPYGLSLAAYLRDSNVRYRVIGTPMKCWLQNMSEGMELKSTGYSSTLYDPKSQLTIKAYCRDKGIPYQDVGLPVKVETFSEYGLAFQKQFVPDVLEEEVVCVDQTDDGFRVDLADGSSIFSSRVVVGVGLEPFRNIPSALAGLGKEFVTHSGEHSNLDKFNDKDVAVIGAGASAIDMATLLHEAGARVQLIARVEELDFGVAEFERRPVWERIIAPMSGVGPGWLNVACTKLPALFPYLPAWLRVYAVNNFLGPSGGWFMYERAQSVPKLLGYEVAHAEVRNNRVCLTLRSPGDGPQKEVSFDHVICGTGYKFDVGRLPILSAGLRRAVRRIDGSPKLSRFFESTVRGLYFIGPISAKTFGPVMRFSAGAGFMARRLSRHLRF